MGGGEGGKGWGGGEGGGGSYEGGGRGWGMTKNARSTGRPLWY